MSSIVIILRHLHFSSAPSAKSGATASGSMRCRLQPRGSPRRGGLRSRRSPRFSVREKGAATSRRDHPHMIRAFLDVRCKRIVRHGLRSACRRPFASATRPEPPMTVATHVGSRTPRAMPPQPETGRVARGIPFFVLYNTTVPFFSFTVLSRLFSSIRAGLSRTIACLRF